MNREQHSEPVTRKPLTLEAMELSVLGNSHDLEIANEITKSEASLKLIESYCKHYGLSSQFGMGETFLLGSPESGLVLSVKADQLASWSIQKDIKTILTIYCRNGGIYDLYIPQEIAANLQPFVAAMASYTARQFPWRVTVRRHPS